MMKTKEYIECIAGQLIEYAQFDFSDQLSIEHSDNEFSDSLASVAVGINILGEELEGKINELNLVKNELERSYEFLKQITGQIQEFIFVYDKKLGEIVYRNKMEESLPENLCICILDGNEDTCKNCDPSSRTTSVCEFSGDEQLCVKESDGTNKWFKILRKSFEITSEGSKEFELISLFDITNEKVREKELIEHQKELTNTVAENEMLLQEVHHRVKNNLQIISGLIDLQINRIPKDSVGANELKNTKNRINSIAIIHEKLYQSNKYAYVNMSLHTRALVGSLVEFYGKDNVKIDYDITPRIFLSLEKAIPLGLIINEVICNSYKHAFSDNMDGTIWISFKEDKGELTLEIHDSGVSVPEKDQCSDQSLGMKLINLLSLQLKSKLVMDLENGYSTKIIIPRFLDLETVSV